MQEQRNSRSYFFFSSRSLSHIHILSLSYTLSFSLSLIYTFYLSHIHFLFIRQSHALTKYTKARILLFSLHFSPYQTIFLPLSIPFHSHSLAFSTTSFSPSFSLILSPVFPCISTSMYM